MFIGLADDRGLGSHSESHSGIHESSEQVVVQTTCSPLLSPSFPALGVLDTGPYISPLVGQSRTRLRSGLESVLGVCAPNCSKTNKNSSLPGENTDLIILKNTTDLFLSVLPSTDVRILNNMGYEKAVPNSFKQLFSDYRS